MCRLRIGKNFCWRLTSKIPNKEVCSSITFTNFTDWRLRPNTNWPSSLRTSSAGRDHYTSSSPLCLKVFIIMYSRIYIYLIVLYNVTCNPVITFFLLLFYLIKGGSESAVTGFYFRCHFREPQSHSLFIAIIFICRSSSAWSWTSDIRCPSDKLVHRFYHNRSYIGGYPLLNNMKRILGNR